MKQYKSTYISVRANGKKVDLHRYVWQSANGPIPKGMVIHHKNGDKHDNRIENLEMLHDKEHRRLHLKEHPIGCGPKWRKSMKKVYSALSKDKDGLYWCYFCKLLLDKERFTKRKNRLSGLDDICKNCRSFIRKKPKKSKNAKTKN